MRTVQVQTPDGRIITLEGPDDATDEQFQQQAAIYDQDYRKRMASPGMGILGEREATPIKKQPIAPPTKLDTLQRQLEQGITFNAADEIKAGLAGLYGEGARLLSDNYVPPAEELYDAAMARDKERIDADWKYNPGIALASNLGGSLFTGGGVAKAVSSLGMKALPTALVTGAAVGGPMSAGAQEGMDRITALIPGAGLGALGGGIGHGAGVVAQKLMGKVGPMKGGETVQRIASTSGKDVDDVATRMRELGPEAQPIDALSGNRTALQKHGELLDAKELDGIIKRGEKTYDRLMRSVGEWGDDAASFKSHKQMAKTRSTQASEAYEKGFDDVQDALGSKILMALRTNATATKGKSEAALAAKRLKSKRGDDTSLFVARQDPKGAAGKLKRYLTMRGVQEVTESLADTARALAKQGKNKEARRIYQEREAIMDAMAGRSKSWAAGRELWASTKRVDDLIEDGTGFMKMKVPELREMARALPESERKYLMMGVGEALQDMISRAKGKAGALDRLDIQQRLNAIDPKYAERLMKAIDREGVFAASEKAAKKAKRSAESAASGKKPKGYQTSLTTAKGLLARVGSELFTAKKEELSESVLREVARSMLDKEKYLKMMTAPISSQQSLIGVPNPAGALGGALASEYVRTF